MVKSKIIATLGPASNTKTILRKMVLAGMDVVRLNFSHGSHEGLLDYIRLTQKLNKKYRRHIKILGDLEGHRIRIGRLKGSKPIELKKRKIIRLTQEDVLGELEVTPLDYRGPLKDIKESQNIYINILALLYIL